MVLYSISESLKINGSLFSFSSLELSYTPPMENKQRKTFPSKISTQHLLTNGAKSRNLPKTRGRVRLFFINTSGLLFSWLSQFLSA